MLSDYDARCACNALCCQTMTLAVRAMCYVVRLWRSLCVQCVMLSDYDARCACNALCCQTMMLAVRAMRYVVRL